MMGVKARVTDDKQIGRKEMPEATSIQEEGQNHDWQTSHCILLQSRMHALKELAGYRLRADSVLQLKFMA